jgi:hypothetical protein
MTRVMAVDLAQHGIRVNAVAPGPIDVPRSRHQHNDERRAAWHNAVPLGRYGEPEEAAAVALFLASDDASYMTGQTVTVDGGFTAAGLKVKNLENRCIAKGREGRCSPRPLPGRVSKCGVTGSSCSPSSPTPSRSSRSSPSRFSGTR